MKLKDYQIKEIKKIHKLLKKRKPNWNRLTKYVKYKEEYGELVCFLTKTKSKEYLLKEIIDCILIDIDLLYSFSITQIDINQLKNSDYSRTLIIKRLRELGSIHKAKEFSVSELILTSDISFITPEEINRSIASLLLLLSHPSLDYTQVEFDIVWSEKITRLFKRHQ